ncbi:hypothetical protein OHB53_08640 [Streptomyces sp. NBC_00056]|uniref:hypothetical protein n=1 Tax=unclassified Streptomyces TaxID=2593676 RepID=UPI00224D58ED|nr:hypothetical protein [Streptomyces sp. NBC_00063]MCX5441348.1 hypothetical protein [Streptomyces sp. NBC_00063]
MTKGGKAKKKLSLPAAGLSVGKRTGDPSTLLPGSQSSNERLCWRFTHVDHDGRWGFSEMEPTVLCEVLRKLADCESMTVQELRSTRRLFKEYDLPGGLCKEALDRLTDMRRDDMTSIQRLEFTGLQRLYGFLDGNVFHVVWWDAHHEVYPSRLRNT